MVLLFVYYHYCNILAWIVSVFLIQKGDSNPTTIIKATEEKQNKNTLDLNHCSTSGEGSPANFCDSVKVTIGESNLDTWAEMWKEERFPWAPGEFSDNNPNGKLENMSQGVDSCLWKGVQRTSTENDFTASCSFDRTIREYILFYLNSLSPPNCKVSKFQQNGGNTLRKQEAIAPLRHGIHWAIGSQSQLWIHKLSMALIINPYTIWSHIYVMAFKGHKHSFFSLFFMGAQQFYSLI